MDLSKSVDSIGKSSPRSSTSHFRAQIRLIQKARAECKKKFEEVDQEIQQFDEFCNKVHQYLEAYVADELRREEEKPRKYSQLR